MGSAEMAQAPLLPPAAPAQAAVEVRGGSFAWSPGAAPLLHDVDLAGELAWLARAVGRPALGRCGDSRRAAGSRTRLC